MVYLVKGVRIDAINVNQIKRIEIIRSATADMSTQGIAGTINIVTKKMENKSRNLSIYADKSASSSFGGMSFEQSDKTENFSYGVSVSVGNGNFSSGRQRALSIQNGLDEPILNYKARLHSKSSSPTLSIDPRLTWVLDNGDTVTMRSRIYYQKVSGQELTDWSVMSGQAPNANGNIVNEKMNDDRKGLNTELNWERKFADEFGGESTLQANFGFTYFNLNSIGLDYAKNSGVQLISSRNTRNNESQQDWNTRGSFNTSLTKTHVMKVGWDAGVTLLDNHKIQIRNQLGIQEPDLNNINHVKINRAALYVQDEWQATPTWSHYFGIRWEMFQTQGSGNNFSQFKNNTGVLSPIFQTLWKLPDSKENQVRFALARTFKNPFPMDLLPSGFASLNNQAVLPDRTGNPFLKPETAMGLDVSFEHFGDNGLKYSASLYSKKIENLIRSDTRLQNNRWVSYTYQ